MRDKEERLSSEITEMQIKLKNIDEQKSQANAHAYDDLKDTNYFVENGRAPSAPKEGEKSSSAEETTVSKESESASASVESKKEAAAYAHNIALTSSSSGSTDEQEKQAEDVPAPPEYDAAVQKEEPEKVVDGEEWEAKQDLLADVAKGKETRVKTPPGSPWEKGDARPASSSEKSEMSGGKTGRVKHHKKHGHGTGPEHPHPVPAAARPHHLRRHRDSRFQKYRKHARDVHKHNMNKRRGHLRREKDTVSDASVSDSFLEGEGVHKVDAEAKVDGGDMEPLSSASGASSDVLDTAADALSASSSAAANGDKAVKVSGMVESTEDTTAARENEALNREKQDGSHDYFHPHMNKGTGYTYQDDNSMSMLEKKSAAAVASAASKKSHLNLHLKTSQKAHLKPHMRDYRARTLNLDDPVPVEAKAGSSSAKFDNVDLDKEEEPDVASTPTLAHGERRNVGIRPAV